MRFSTLFLPILILILYSSCGKNYQLEGIRLSTTPVLQIQNLFGVIAHPTLRIRSQPSEEGEIVTVLVRGTIVEIELMDQRDMIIDGQEGRWMKIRYQGRRGWAFGGFVQVFDSLEKARRGVQALFLTE